MLPDPPDISESFPPTSPPRQWRNLLRKHGVALALLLVLYGALVGIRLPQQDLDMDELITARIMNYRVNTLVQDRFTRGHPPLFFLLERQWTNLLGRTTMSLTTISVVMGAISIVMMLVIGLEAGLGRWAWVAALFWAAHPMMIFYARYARPYAGVMTIAIVELWLMLLILRRPESRLYIYLLLVGAIGAFWNHTLFLAMIGGAAAIASMPELRRRTRPAFWGTWALAFSFHPLMMWMCSQSRGKKDPLGWVILPDFPEFISHWLKFLGQKELHIQRPDDFWVVPIYLIGSMFFVFWHSFVSPRPEELREVAIGPDPSALTVRQRWKFITVATLIPLAMMIAITYISKPLFFPRYLIVLLPGFILCAARSLSLIPYPAISILIIMVLTPMMGYENFKLIRNRQTGLRKSIATLEEVYNPETDVVMAFSPETIEAVKIFSDKEFKTFMAPIPKGTDAEWNYMHDSIKGHKRMWVIAWRSKGGIMSLPRWERESWKWFKSYDEDYTKLMGYNILDAGPQIPTPPEPASETPPEPVSTPDY